MDELGVALVATEEGGSGRRRTTTPRRDGGDANWAQTLVNIVVSIVGTGVLGLPYAFKASGWLAGALGVSAAGLSTCHCMILLVQCKDKVEEAAATVEPGERIRTYGDLGAKAFGRGGRYLTEFLVITSQAGGAVAYLVFIGQNLSSMLSSDVDHPVAPVALIFLVLLPLEIALSFVRRLSSLAPFSAFADVCSVLAMAVVFKVDIHMLEGSSVGTRSAFAGVWGLPFAAGVSVFCFEGFSMTLPLEASMADRRRFPAVLRRAFLGITLAYACFGALGYLAYGEETMDIITLNLPNNWTGAAVKVGLCAALAFTFPVMMHPIHEMLELKLKSSRRFQEACFNRRGVEHMCLHSVRILTVGATAVSASFIPSFGVFISLVGSSVCAMLAFVLPASIHLVLMGSSIGLWQRILDCCIFVVGAVFACYGTYAAVVGDNGFS